MSGKSNSHEMDMCNGPLLSKIIVFALPLMASSLLQLFFNAADVIVVGRFAGDNALAAVGSNGSIVGLLTNIFLGLSVGANVLIARFYAAKRLDAVTETVQTAVATAIISGLILNLIGFVFARQILVWMASPEDVIDLAALYLRTYFFGMVAMMLYNFGAAILRSVGDTKRPLIYLTIAGVINVILNLFFVIVLKMSVVGVGLATVISQWISGLLVLRCLCRETGAVHLELKSLYIKKDKLLQMIQIGVPAGMQGIVFSISNVIIQSAINSFGSVIVAGSSAGANLEGFCWVAMNAFTQAAITFTSQNYGAGKFDRIKKIIFETQACEIIAGGVMGTLWVALGPELLTFYTTSQDVIDAGMIRMVCICSLYFTCGMMDCMAGTLRGLGYSLMPTIVSVAGVCGIRLIWIATGFQTAAWHTPRSLFLTYPVSWIVTLTLHALCLFIVWNTKIKKMRMKE